MDGAIYKLIPKIMSEVGSIEKSRTNKQQGYAFRGIDDIYAALQSILSSNGVFFATEVLEQVREERASKGGGALIYTILKVKFRVTASDGSAVDIITVGEAMDSGDKSANKAMSAALKYAALQLFFIPTEGDNDTENKSPDPLPKNQPPKMPPKQEQKTPPRFPPKQEQKSPAQTEPNYIPNAAKKASTKQLSLMKGRGIQTGWTKDDITAYCSFTYNINSPYELNQVQFEEMLDVVTNYKPDGTPIKK